MSTAIFKKLQNTKLDDQPYIDKNGDVNKNYKFLRISGNFAPLGGIKSVIIFPSVIGIC
jgi:hypothetical protein